MATSDDAWLKGWCDNCGYPAVVTGHTEAVETPRLYPDEQRGAGYDYTWFCANPDCKNHDPVGCYAQEPPEWLQEGDRA